ncbi:MAG: hypothetical protein R3C71_04900 [Candidatus Krumholzibacteriia bacterium]|nr:hypothetical protein [bacterium]
MKTAMKISLLALLILGLFGSSSLAGDRIFYSILVQPGMTEFSFAGESFVVVTTQKLRIDFDGITSMRVWGSLTSMDGELGVVKFVWTSAGNNPITLHEGVLGGRTWNFDSDNVTGHNEKFD